MSDSHPFHKATPRRARGVVRTAERLPVRKLRDRVTEGRGPLPQTLEAAVRDAPAGQGHDAPWRSRIRERQRSIRRAYVALALTLSRSARAQDRALGSALEAFVRGMPPVETRADRIQRLAAEASNTRPRDGPERNRGPTRKR